MTEANYLSLLEKANTCVADGHYTEAIKILEPMVSLEPMVNSKISAIQGVISFNIGDSYRSCDGKENNIRAKEHLCRAIELASSAGDNQVIVAAKAALAQVETTLGNEEKAKQYRQEARDKFQALPEPSKWEILEERLEESSGEIEYLLFLSGCRECKPIHFNCPPGQDNCGRFSGHPNTRRCLIC